MTVRLWLVVLLSGTLALWAYALSLPTTAPATAPAGVSVKLTLTSTRPIHQVLAIDRSLADPLAVSQAKPGPGIYTPRSSNTSPPTYTFDKLLPGRLYDLIVWDDQTRWEGVTMDYHRPIEPTGAIKPEGRVWIEDFIRKMPQFYDHCRPLWMAADNGHATVLVELIRNRDFHSAKQGEVIYRTELWYFENLYGGWAKDRNTEKVVTRLRGQPDKLPANLIYCPSLGGQMASATQPAWKLTLPEAPDPKRGIVRGQYAPAPSATQPAEQP